MKSRWLSTFTVIGIVLIVLSIAGLVLGPRFVFDPGQPYDASHSKTPFYYLIIGILMVVNGLMTPAPLPLEKASTNKSEKTVGKNGTAAVTTQKPKSREIIATSADKSSGE